MGPGGRRLVGLGCSWLMLVMRCVLQVLIVRLAGLRMSMVQMAGLRLGGEVVQIPIGANSSLASFNPVSE